MSTSGKRCAYLAGSAYLLGLRFFFGRGEGSETSWAVVDVVVRVRLVDRIGDADVGTPFRGERVVSTYWYLVNVPWKDAVGGVVGVSSLLGTNCGAFAPELSDIAEAVIRIFKFDSPSRYFELC
jgi:hypothetical protein